MDLHEMTDAQLDAVIEDRWARVDELYRHLMTPGALRIHELRHTVFDNALVAAQSAHAEKAQRFPLGGTG